MTDWSKFANFTEAEFVCKGVDCCGGRADMQESFMVRLQRVRDAFRRPMVITSGFRCPEHDAAIGGAGVHPKGRAADISVSGRDCFAMIDLAISKGMTGIGLKQHGTHVTRFAHLDDLSGPTRPWFWTYR